MQATKDMIADSMTCRLTLVLDIETPQSCNCRECGDSGYIYLFLATDGPFDHPGNPYLGTPEKPIVSKFHNGKWWLGETKAYPCESCRGVNAQRPTRQAGFND